MDFSKFRRELKAEGKISKDYIFQLINSIEQNYVKAVTDQNRVFNVGKVYKPTHVACYDIVTNMVCGSPHPCMVFKVTDEFVYVVSFSTTEAVHNVHRFEKSRIFVGNYMTNTILRLSKADALDNFIGIFDNKKEADVALTKLRDTYKGLFKI